MSDRLSEIRARLDAADTQVIEGTLRDAPILDDVRWLLDAVDEVRRIHEPVEALEVRSQRVGNVCAGCGTDDGNWVAWPCPTLRALGVES